jgi:hypothetical protein
VRVKEERNKKVGEGEGGDNQSVKTREIEG